MVFLFAAGLFAVVTIICECRGNVVLDPGIVIHKAPSYVIAQKNSPLLLNCSATSSPDHGQVQFSWHKDGQPLVSDKRVQINNNGSLYFTEVKRNRNRNRNHNGFYECFMKNNVGTVIARQVHLIVARISKDFSIEPEDQNVIERGVARFKCQIDGIPPPFYVWEKDGVPLPHDSRFTTLTSGILQIHNVSIYDAGAYHCSAYQSFNKVNNLPDAIDVTWQHSREAQLKVTKDPDRRPPKIVAISKEVNATVEESLTLECLADGNPTPTVTWMKGDTPTLEDNFKEGYGTSNLRFIKVNREDAGIYKCIASSPGFPDAVNETKLYVRVPPVLLDAPVSEMHPVAKRFRLKCTVEGIPTPVVTWYRNGEKLKPNGRIQVNPDNMLVIDSSDDDSGYYQCIAENEVGVVMATARLLILLQENAPKPPGNVTVTEVTKDTICIKWLPSAYTDCCPVLAYTVHYKDLSNDASYDNKKATQNQSACVDKLRPFTEYQFYVRAYSTMAASSESNIITICTSGSVPTMSPNLRLSSSTPFSIDLDWDLLPTNKCHGNITGYQIFLMIGKQETIENVSAANRSHTIQNLQPDTEYKVRILAGTSMGFPKLENKDWPWLAHRTPKDNDEATVKAKIDVRQLNLTCVEVNWNITDKLLLVQSYKIYVTSFLSENQLRKNGAAQVFYPMKNSNIFMICDLETEKFYELMFVVHGHSEPLATVEEIFQIVEKDKQPLPPPPLQITAFPESSTQILVRWRRPGLQHEIKFYYVQYYKKDNLQQLMYVRSDTTEYVLTDLEPFTVYCIRVRSHTLHEHSIFTDEVEIRTNEDVPSAPEGLSIIGRDKDQVQLKWDPPIKQNGIIISYIVLYHQEKEDPEILWSSLEKNGTITSTIISGISDDSNYFFKVRACTKEGKGQVSQIVEIKPWICRVQCVHPEDVPMLTDDGSILKDQRLGIIIGCSIGLSSIIICIVVVVVRHRHYSRMYINHQVITGNHDDRNVGQYLSNQNGRSPYHAVDEDSRLIQENVNSDTKGPDNTLQFLGNGRVIYLCNGSAPNGKIRAYVASPVKNGQTAETMALITSRSAHVMAGDPQQDSNMYITHSQSEGNVPSIPLKSSERGYTHQYRQPSKNSYDIENPTSDCGTSQAIGASHVRHSGSHGNHDLNDNGDLISKMLQATTSYSDCSDKSSTLPQRLGSRSSVTMESTDLLSVDA